MRVIRKAFIAGTALLGPLSTNVIAAIYETPDAELDRILMAPLSKELLTSSRGLQRKSVLVGQPYGLRSITELGRPELGLAGIRFDPVTYSLARQPWGQTYFRRLGMLTIGDSLERTIAGLPEDLRITAVEWAPDGRRIAVMAADLDSVDPGQGLWIVDVAGPRATRLPIRLNGIAGKPCAWMSNSSDLICRAIPEKSGLPLSDSSSPPGPSIQDHEGRPTPAWTYQDLLKSNADERLLSYYLSAQIVRISVAGERKLLGASGLITRVEPSPDRHYVLMEERRTPFSYELPYSRFPLRVSVLETENGKTTIIADKPLADGIPISYDAVEPGPRSFGWIPGEPSTLFWVEAADDGDPDRSTEIRDRVMALPSPFGMPPRVLAGLALRCFDIEWAESGFALVDERWRAARKRQILYVDLGGRPESARLLYEGSLDDRYGDPGEPLLTEGTAGKPVLQIVTNKHAVYFRSAGASPDGDRPYLSEFDLDAGNSRVVWRSEPPHYEEPVAVLDDGRILFRRESPTENPNYYLSNGDGRISALSRFENPYGDVPLPEKRVLHYQRSDGVKLTAKLYLPPGYDADDGALPTILQAYPAEFKSRREAGQVSGSAYSFYGHELHRVLPEGLALIFATRGYAVLFQASIPIIGEGDRQPNDTYVDQLVSSAQAAIAAGKQAGFVDDERVAVVGHSYGAFMAANLLAHSGLFRAGVAMSGAYNRTLTPFGFQYEVRTYWNAPSLYFEMSPFSYADRFTSPLLLFHGKEDENSGTYPMQSERLYAALSGNGKTVRLVLLPNETHIYSGIPSLRHVVWEMDKWFRMYLKGGHQKMKQSR